MNRSILTRKPDLQEAITALEEIDEACALPDLKDYLTNVRYYFNREDGDRQWRRQSPLSEANRFGDLLAKLTGLPAEQCRDGARAELDPQWSDIVLAEIVQFAGRNPSEGFKAR